MAQFQSLHVNYKVSNSLPIIANDQFFNYVKYSRIRNINCDTAYQTAESLNFKLSLKKQIWAGTQSDTNVMEISRPLSWGAQTSSAALHNKTYFYDSEALLT
jgi:hypothetical protein